MFREIHSENQLDFPSNKITKEIHNETMNGPEKNVFFVIFCLGQEVKYTKQVISLTVLLKSAAMLTRSLLRFHIVTWNTVESKEVIKQITGEWPDEYRSRLLFTYHNATYPPGAEQGRKPCATLRLYFPELFPEIDAAVYLDTD
ncbi:unnamed protein product, partial [Meganyctiphanes norvegica]